MFAANLAWDWILLLLTIGRLIDPGSTADYLVLASIWLLPFIGYLIVLYRKGVLARWRWRVFRAIALCGVSFAVTEIALVVAAPLTRLVPFAPR